MRGKGRPRNAASGTLSLYARPWGLDYSDVPGESRAESSQPGKAEEWIAPVEPGPGEAVCASGHARPLASKLTAHSLRVEHEIPEGVEVVATAPASKRMGNKLVWFFGEVQAEQRLSLKVTVRTKDPDWKPSTNRAAFLARYSCRGAVVVPVVRQAVKVAVDAPNEIEIGASGHFNVRVSNPGNWPLRAGASTIVRISVSTHVN